MKILMLVPFLPNTSMSGGQTRWYNIIKYLSQSHEITLFSLIKDESERKFIPELEKYCKKVQVFSRPKSPWSIKNVLVAELGVYPLVVIRNWSRAERSAVEKELRSQKYDLIHAEAFYVMPHIPKTDTPTILVEQTIEYQVYKHYVDSKVPFYLKPFYLLDVMKCRFWEQYFWKKTDRLVAVSGDDKKIMQSLLPDIGVDIIPNGVDAAHFAAKKLPKYDPPRVMYGVTNFEWLQNVEAVDILLDEVWPIIHEKMPNVKLWIVGRKFPKKILDLAATRSDIEITESIADARDAYVKASVMVTPIRGSGGTRLKVLEAMAAGLPIVSTSIGVAGLDLTHGKQAMISDTAEGLALETVALLKNPQRAEAIGRAGQAYIRANYDWKAVVKLHDKIYERVVRNKTS